MQDDIRCLESKGIKTPASILFRQNFSWGFLQNIWQKFVKIILVDTQEIQVRQKVDRHGNQYWFVYDPVTGRSFASGSEADVSMWIEQTYRY
ncbi:hypothetical protein [Nostoc sp. TCL26-01]|uniref:hypothetical protein n=1 Tax=Nostoc sp. TCL26-01 TaxID=2576904 RepID=UPI0015BDA72A|nr:hypothetical protein [Nostoc sp. TCL26-01]QLE55542.1 hypothetical protein FD725_08450 [Nostoc sp. TCL26-01]